MLKEIRLQRLAAWRSSPGSFTDVTAEVKGL